ncbi:hypothetical protein T05_9545 [Trichinella murrelli]|uniref:Uncharacterized protein n=1 Tax=Trichinella murrelli TaxID=144512 RepID=A0A0V0TLZ4_9BILA|nr:hypothetical protein T05_9545 [Trichinella murrelli]
MPMCLLCQKVLKEKIRNHPNLKTFSKAPGTVDCERGLKASYSISINIAKNAQSYTIGDYRLSEEIIIPAIMLGGR